MKKAILLVLLIASIGSGAHAETTANQWRFGMGMPDKGDQQDGRHIEIHWTRIDNTNKVKVAVLRRIVHEQAWWDHRTGWRKAEDPPDVGYGPVDINSQPQFGATFVNGTVRLQDLGKPIQIVDGPVQIIGHTFAVGDPIGVWTLIGMVDDDGTQQSFVDEVPPGPSYVYALVPYTPGAEDGQMVEFPEYAIQSWAASPDTSFFNLDRWFFASLVAATALLFLGFMQLAKTRAKSMFIRRIPGVDAIEDAIGRSTEMGRPVLYVTGTDEITNIQTMASLLILGHVAQMTAEYDTEIKVANLYPLTMVVAEEIVRQGYSNAGRIDAHKPENVMFITSEQFAYAAAINGMIMRDKPATNIFLGRFFAESLMLSETGFVVGAVQVAGTAEFTQLPFFIAACDYTLIGEELYATSAYLTREPNLLAQLKAGDALKMNIMILIVAGVIAATFWGFDLGAKLMPS
ncbi:MAG TPA: DUF6754 domain-containing protein [Kofleriaceae bacterium]|nr:DUF6754 domain-containing protein [Kofleriaceae bacterium]